MAAGQTDELLPPISIINIRVPKSVLEGVTTLAGLDRGCSLTKIIYVDKETGDHGDHVTLSCALFHNTHFDKSLDWIKAKAILPEEGNFHVTGAGSVKYRSQLIERLKLNIVFIDEFKSQCRGSHFLIEHLNEEDYLMPMEEVKLDKPMVESAMMDNIIESFKRKTQTEQPEEDKDSEPKKHKLPALFAFMGSGGGLTLLCRDGTARFVGGISMGGKTFIGLAKCLLGTSNYKEITDLASHGNRGNTDTLVRDILNEDEDSPYGRMNGDIPIFPFGKAMDQDRGLETFAKEDLALSLVGLVQMTMMNSLMLACVAEKVANVYIGGNMIQAEVFLREHMRVKTLFGHDFINIKFLKTGHTGAIGAMISQPGGEDSFFGFNKSEGAK